MASPIRDPKVESQLTTYTVVGIWDGSDPVVAGVIEGEHHCVDRDDGAPRELHGRWATHVRAIDPDAAEAAGFVAMLVTLEPEEGDED